MMPYKGALRAVYQKAIKPACKEAGYEAKRLDESKRTISIDKEIVQWIFSSDIIVADMTGWNPNVFYEMGVAHTIDNKTIHIINKTGDLPFDVRPYRCIRYSQTPKGLTELKKDLCEFIGEFEKWPGEPGNPVQDFKPRKVYFSKRDVSELNKKLHQAKKDQKKLRLKLQSAEKRLCCQLRSEPLERIDVQKVRSILSDNDFFDSSSNGSGTGIYHNYTVIARERKKMVTDTITGLSWQAAGIARKVSFSGAKRSISNLNKSRFGGFGEWRLPTLEEAMSLMEHEKNRYGLYIDEAFSEKQPSVWTSDSESTNEVWIVDFKRGKCESTGMENRYYVRAVRTTQASDLALLGYK